MAETVSVITLQGKDELSKVLAENNKQFKSFGKTAKETDKQINVFNKSLKATKEGFSAISENSKDAVGNIKGLNYGFKSSYKDSLSFGQNLIKTSDTVDDLTSGFKGLALTLTGTKSKFNLLGQAIGGPANELRTIAESRDDTEKFFNVLTRVSTPVSKSFTFLGNKAEFVRKNIGQLEKGTISLSKTMTNVGAKSLTMFSGTFDTLAESIKKRGGLFSGTIANTLGGIGDAADKASKDIAKFNSKLNADDLNKVDKAGISVAKTFGNLEDKFKGLAKGVEAADFVGNMYLSLRATQDFINDGLIPAALVTKDVAEGATGVGVAFVGAAGPMSALGAVAGFVKGAFRGLKRSMLEVVAQFDDIATAATVMTLVINGVKNARMAMADLGTATDIMVSLGLPTYAMEIADSMGLVGENLIFSTQAAKEFGQAAVTAFAQFEDAASFVTTLTSGEAFQFGNSAAGIDSITAAMNKLVSGPLDNMVTSVEASNALYNALSAGVGITAGRVDELGRSVANTNEVLKFMEAGLKLSSATGTDAASSMEVLSKVTEVYNLSNLQASETAAKLNAIVENGVTTFPQLVGGLSRTASVAASANISIDELFGSVSALTRVMTTQDVQTGYASLISAIAGQGAQAQKAVKELGIQFDIQTVKSDGLIESLRRLNEATNGNITKLKEIIPDQLAFQTAQTLMNTSMEDAVDIMGKVANANEGSLDQIFSNRSQSMIRRMTALANGFNETLIEFGQRALPMVEPGLVFMENLLNTLNNLPNPIKNLIGMLILFHSGLSRVVDTTLSLISSFVQITATLIFFRLMSSAMKSLGNITSGAVEKRGGLRDFIGIFKYLLFEEKNIVAAYSHITGINRKYQNQLIETIKAERRFEEVRRRTSEAMKNDPSYEIARGDLESYGKQLKRITEERKKAQTRSREAPELGLEDRVKELVQLENSYKKLIAQEKASRKELLEDSNRAVKKAMQDTNQDITQMRKQLITSMADSFSSFDEKTLEEMKKFAATTDKILERQDINTETKLAAIRQHFREVLEGVPEHNKASTQLIVNNFMAHMRELEDLPGRFKQKVAHAYKALVQSLPEEARKELSEADKLGLEFISDLTKPIKERKQEVRKLVNNLVKNLPSDISRNAPEIQKAFEDLITPDPKNLDFREGVFQNKIKKLLQAMGDTATDEVKDEVIQLQKALLEFSRVFNEPPKADKQLWARIFLSQGKEALDVVDTVFQELTNEFDAFTSNVNSEAKSNGGSVKAYFMALKQATITAANGTKQEIDNELQKVKEAYENIDIEDETVKAKLKKYYEDLVAVANNKFAEMKEVVTAKTQDINLALEGISDEKVQKQLKGSLEEAQQEFDRGLDRIEATVKPEDREEKLKELVQRFNQRLSQIANHPDVINSVKEGFNKVQKTVKEKTQEITDVANDTVEKQKGSGSRMGGILESLLYSGSSLAGVNIGPLSDIIDVAKDSADAYEELTASTEKNRKATKENAQGLIGIWGKRKEQIALMKETGEQQNFLVAGLNTLGATYEQVFMAMSKAIGLDKLYVKWGLMKAETTTAETVAEGAKTKATLASTFADKAALVSTKLRNIGIAISTGLLSAQTAATMALDTATKALGATITAIYGSVLLPLVITLGIAATAVWGLAKAFGFLPTVQEKVRRSTVDNIKVLQELREEQAKTAEEQGQNTKAYKENVNQLNRNLEDQYERAIGLRGAIRDVNKEFQFLTKLPIASNLVEVAKSFISLGVLSNIKENITQVGKNFKILTENTKLYLENLPVLGKVFSQIADSNKAMWGFIGRLQEDAQKKVEETKAKYVEFKKTIGIKKETLEAVKDLRALTEETTRLANAGNELQKQGQAASQRGQEILARVKKEQRAFTADELKEFTQAENQYLENEKAVINARLEGLDKDIEIFEKRKKLNKSEQYELDALKEERKKTVDSLQGLEESSKRVIDYQNNLNALYNAVEENQASSSIEETNKRLTETYERLPKEAKKAYSEILNLKFVESVNENGERVSIAMQDQYDLFNRGQRQKFNAFAQSLANMADNVSTATDINNQETLDKLQNDVFNFAESAQDMIAAGFDPDTVVADFEQGLDTLKIQLEGAGMTAEQLDLLDAAGQEAMMGVIFDMYKASTDKIVAENNHKIELLKHSNQLGVGDYSDNLAEINHLTEENAASEIEMNKKKLDKMKEAGLETSMDYLDLQRQVAEQEIALDQLVYENKINLIDAELEKAKALSDHKIAMLESGPDSVSEIKEIGKEKEKAIEAEIAANKEKLETMKEAGREDSEEYLALKRETALKEEQLDNQILENKLQNIDIEITEEKRKSDLKLANLNSELETGKGNRIEIIKQINEVNEESLRLDIEANEKKIELYNKDRKWFSQKSEEQIELEQKVAQQKIQLDTLVYENKVKLIDEELKIEQDYLNRRINLIKNETALGQRSTEEMIVETGKLQQESIQNEIDAVREKMKLTEVGSTEYQELMGEQAALQISLDKAVYDNQIALIDAKEKRLAESNDLLLEQLKLQKEQGIGDQQALLASIGKVEQEQLQNSINANKEKLALAVEGSEDYITLQKTIALQEMQLDKLVIDNKLALIDEELGRYKEVQENKTSILSLQNQLNIGDSVRNIEELNRLSEDQAKQEIQSNKDKLAELASANLQGSEEYLRLQREVALQEIQLDKLVIDNKVKLLEEENRLVEQKYQNEIAALKNISDAQIQVLDLERKRQEFNIKLTESRNAVISAMEDYEIAALENINKLETDISDKAENQLEIFIKRGEAQERVREFEVLSLENQQRANEIALLREKTTIRIGKAEAQLAVIQAQNAIAQAKVRNAREEELRGLQLALEAAQLTLESYDQQALILQEQEQFQQEMFDNEVKALEARHRAQEEAYSTDLILQQNQAALAAYDEQISKLQNMSQIQRITTDIQVQKREAENTLLQGQIDILKQQQEFVNSSNQSQQDAYSLAISMSKSEYKRRKLEKEAAEARLKNLKATQETEERIFKLNQKQQKLALEMSVLKSDAAASQAQAELAVARAEAQKVMADVTATEEQKAAAVATVAAAEATLQSAQMQQIITREQQNVFDQTSLLQQQQFEQQQRMVELQAKGDLASKTRGWGDDFAVQREALAVGRGRTAEQQREYEIQQARQRERNKPTEEEIRRERQLMEQEAATLTRSMREQVQELQSSQESTLDLNFEELVSNSSLQLVDMSNLLQTAMEIKDFLFRTNQNTLPVPTQLPQVNPTINGLLDINLNLTVDGDTGNLDTEDLNSKVSDVVYNGLYDLFEDMRRSVV